MYVTPLAVTQPIWKNVSRFGQDYVKSNPLEGFANSILTLDSPAAYPACLDFCNYPLHNLAKAHTENSTFHHCYISFGVELRFKSVLRGLRNVEVIVLENNCYILTASIETWYDLIIKLLVPNDNPSSVAPRQVLCHILLHLEKIGFREMFAKFEKKKVSEDLYYIREV